jgi:hypothetical protein
LPLFPAAPFFVWRRSGWISKRALLLALPLLLLSSSPALLLLLSVAVVTGVPACAPSREMLLIRQDVYQYDFMCACPPAGG